MRSSVPRVWLAALTCAAFVGVCAPEVRAETVRLKSGAAYEAASVEVKGESLVLRLSLGMGTGTASFPFASIHAGDLARILAARIAQQGQTGHHQCRYDGRSGSSRQLQFFLRSGHRKF